MRQIEARRGALLVLLGVCIASALPWGSPRAESLWREGSVNLFSNYKAMKVGDIVTVIIAEDATASSQTQMKSNKKNETTLAGKGVGALDFIPLFGLDGEYEKKFDGKGQTSVAGRMNARVTATVIEIRPSGNLVIEGSRTVQINNDTDVITVRGILRPQDIASDNTVLSTFLSEAQIGYTGSGPSKNTAKQGLLARFLDLFF